MKLTGQPINIIVQTLHTTREPRYWQLKEQLRRQIMDGELLPGSRLPSRVEMQQRFGVSTVTIQKVYSLLEQEGLVVSRQGAGTFVAEPAQHARTGIIGFLDLPQTLTEAPYFVRILKGMREAARAAEYEILLLDEGSSAAHWDNIDGAISRFALQAGQNVPAGMPCVTIVEPTLAGSHVSADDYGAIRSAVEYLGGLGHRRIAYLCGDRANPIVRERVRGYEDATRALEVPDSRQWLRAFEEYSPEDFQGAGRDNMRRWLADGWTGLECTALLVHNDRAAIGAMEALREAGLRVPEDVSVVGFDSTDECELCSPRLTSVAVPLEEIGRHAVDMLLRHIDAATPTPESIVLPTRIDERNSVTAIRTGA